MYEISVAKALLHDVAFQELLSQNVMLQYLVMLHHLRNKPDIALNIFLLSTFPLKDIIRQDNKYNST